ncbi:MAG: YecA family protein [Oxalobacteraceae bacterium]|nr:YecA family protein [Oxalobacteraceae bacterium]
MSDQPLLTDEEFDELDRFLMSSQCGDETMAMDALNGYLSAIAIGPVDVAPAQWLPRIWGPTPQDAPKFRDAQQSARIHELLSRALEEIRVTFEVAPKDFEPLFSVHKFKGKELLDAEAWCWGFLEAISLNEAAWRPLRASSQAILLRAIDLLGAEEIDDTQLVLVDDPVKCHKLAVEVEASVPQIQRFWLKPLQ